MGLLRGGRPDLVPPLRIRQLIPETITAKQILRPRHVLPLRQVHPRNLPGTDSLRQPALVRMILGLLCRNTPGEHHQMQDRIIIRHAFPRPRTAGVQAAVTHMNHCITSPRNIQEDHRTLSTVEGIPPLRNNSLMGIDNSLLQHLSGQLHISTILQSFRPSCVQNLHYLGRGLCTTLMPAGTIRNNSQSGLIRCANHTGILLFTSISQSGKQGYPTGRN